LVAENCPLARAKEAGWRWYTSEVTVASNSAYGTLAALDAPDCLAFAGGGSAKRGAV